MRAKNTLALIFTNTNDNLLPELTVHRSMASVPFGARYRLIDFHISGLINAGVDNVGIIPFARYRSLMDHLGAGKPWDLDRKKGGLHFLPPFITTGSDGTYRDHIHAIENISGFIDDHSEEYVIVIDSDIVCNIDVAKMCEQHIKSGADVTVAYKNGPLPDYHRRRPVFTFGDDGFATEVRISQDVGKVCNYSIGSVIFSKKDLLKYVKDAAETGYGSISEGILQRHQEALKIYGYEHTEFAMPITDIASYISANMALLEPKNRQELFSSKRPIYTKTRDDCPTKYGLSSNVKNSLIADGCTINGTVENCIIFRGVNIGKGAVVRDSIIMQGTNIGKDCDIQYVICDKDVTVSDSTKLTGAKENHFLIKKGIEV